MHCDVAIFGGGVAGLWLLDTLHQRGHSAVLLEAATLGSGQTIASQGIIHGGLKYTLQGLLTTSASNIAEMPGLWRECLQGRRQPDLTGVQVRAEHCHLWRTDSFASRMGMIGARIGLRVAPQTVNRDDRPAILKHCPGDVARLDEQVISPRSFLSRLAERHQSRLLQIDPERHTRFQISEGIVQQIELRRPNSAAAPQILMLQPRWVVLTAGAGNARLREQLGLPANAMQRRPLQMVMARGPLPMLNGHCVDGAKTRVTVTSDRDAQGRTVWQIGGQLAEEGVTMTEETLVERARAELEAAIPGIDLSAVEWATYRVDRAEAVTAGGRRPDSFQVLREGNVLIAWPTKLVLAPVLAESLATTIGPPANTPAKPASWPADWPRPQVALPPWETARQWHTLPTPQRRAA